MAAGQKSESGAKTSLDDEKIRTDDILSNRDIAQRRPRQSVDGKEVQAEEYKDTFTNQRPPEEDDGIKPDQSETGKTKKIDRPGFDLGGATGETSAGKGLGLGNDAKEGRKGWGLPRRAK